MTILSTRVTVPPPRPDWVARHRRQLTLVCAPAGFGKTTLITAWLHAVNERCGGTPRVAWLSLEESDNTALRFGSYLTAALNAFGSRIGHFGARAARGASSGRSWRISSRPAAPDSSMTRDARP